MIPNSFDCHTPTSVDEAIRLLHDLGDEAQVLAGGHSLLPMMKLRFTQPKHLIDLNRISRLKGISERDGTVHIGALTTQSELLSSALLREKCPLLPDAAQWIADPQVRNCGTLGGNISHGDPGNDQPAVMLATEASFVLQGPGGERVVAADGYFHGLFHNERAPDEILTEIRIPVAPAGIGYAYCKLKRKNGDFATAAAAVQLQLDGGICKKINIALTNVATTAIKVKEAETLLMGKAIDENLINQAATQAMALCDPTEDLRGSREYKISMAGEMTRRAIRLALARARGN